MSVAVSASTEATPAATGGSGGGLADPGSEPAPPGLARLVAAVVALVALATLSWHLSRPALWLDESASVAATRRTWPHLLRLLHDSDAPLVPYYALLKATTGLTTAIWPGAAGHPELLFRWPSLVVTVLAAWLLTRWLAGQAGLRVAVASAGVLLLSSATSFYAQDARPYAFALAAAVAASAVLTRLLREPRPRWVILYALCVAGLLDAHLMAGSLLAAHLVAAVVWPVPESAAASAEPASSRIAPRRRGVGAMLLGGVIGLVAGGPFAVFAGVHGQGVISSGNTVSARSLRDAFAELFTEGHSHRLGLAAILLLALIGISCVRPGRHAAIARLAACWAIVPLVLLVPLFVLKPHLLQSRYALFLLPGWAVLAGLGLVTLIDAVVRVLQRRSLPKAGAAGIGLGVLLLAGIASQQLHGWQQVRSSGGHGENLRPSLQLADSPAYAGVPIVLSLRSSLLELAAYDQADLPRVYGLAAQLDRASIWPARTSPAQRSGLLAGARRVLVLYRDDSLHSCPASADTDPGRLARCLPGALVPSRYHYRVSAVRPGGRGWVLVVLQR